MSEEARYVRVGAFVFGGIALVVAGVLLFGGGRLLARKPVLVETVFEESVQGLDVGSPVKLRGVQLGTVSEITFVGDVYDVSSAPDPLREGRLVLVRMALRPSSDQPQDPQSQAERMRRLVDAGMRLRMTPLGITGTFFLQADFVDPAKFPPIPLSFEPEGVYVPSAPSTITQLSGAAERLISRIDALDVEGLLTNFDTLLVTLNQTIGQADVSGARATLGDLLADLRETSAAARRAVESANLRGTTEEARRALEQMTVTLARLQRMADASGDDLAVTLDNLRAASENLREASETARAYPSFLLFGEPPRPLGEDD
jgi:phospholipid/cholesterol/gamma-HCH transport system substrate-binding protein/paraquat-inducible protein B